MLCQDARRMREQLGEKDGELVGLVEALREKERGLAQAMEERQSLHVDVQLLRGVHGEAEARAARERALREDADRRRGELERRCRAAEGRWRDEERLRRSAEERLGGAEAQLEEQRLALLQAEAAARGAELQAEGARSDAARRLRDSERLLEQQADAR